MTTTPPPQLQERAAAYVFGALLSFALAVAIGITTTADWGRLVCLLLTLCAAVFMGGATALSEFIDKEADKLLDLEDAERAQAKR